jgi:alkylation response protein AidB-like acyl-CoA dehydrogenase
MALVLNEEQLMLRDAARDFLNGRAPVSHLRALRDQDSESGYSPGLWQQMAEMGWPAMAVPEDWGGLGFGYTGLGIVLQECGHTLTPSPLLGSAMMATAALLRAGSEAQKSGLLPALASGTSIAALAVDEHDPYRPQQVSAQASRSGQGFVLNGRKRFVLDGMAADTLILSARTAGQPSDATGVSLFLVPCSAPGLARTRCRILDTHVVADISLQQVQVAEDALLGTEHEGLPVLEYALDTGRIGQSAELLGVALEAFARTLAYLKERKQFGVPIGSFQALQHRAAMLFSELEMCKSLVLHALQQLDAGTAGLAELASMAKAKLAEVASRVTGEAIQMHGGIGMTDEFDIGLFLKRARILETLLGDRYYHLDRYARLNGY